LCGSKKDLHVHHLERWIDAPTKRLDVTNGATLCEPCHMKHHAYKGERFPAHITMHLQAIVLNLKPVHSAPKPKRVLIKRAVKEVYADEADPIEQFNRYMAMGY